MIAPLAENPLQAIVPPLPIGQRQYRCIDVNPPLCDGGAMAGRSSQLQIRITPEQKEVLKRLSHRAGQDMSAYVLSRALPDARMRFARLLEALRDDDRPGFALAELNDLLSGLTSGELCDAVEHADLTGLTPYLRNYVAAMVELAAHRRDVPPPAWVRDVEPMEMEPRFATPLAGLRLHLLRMAPVPFKRRNIFIDSSLGDRV
jgi:uncharacterized protein (DUF1778 family)